MKKRLLFLLWGGLFLAGCATGQKQMYYWEDYSHTLYQLKKEPTEEHRLAHKEMLLQIISRSKEENVRVPPGVYCELGSIVAAEGNRKEAASYFDREMEAYPESAVLVTRLKSQLEQE